MGTERSDYDVYLIVRRNVGEYRRKLPFRHGEDPEISVFSLAEFRRHAAIGSPSEWNRYSFAYYRSAKNYRDGDELGGRLDAAESLSGFLTALFALHERVRPYNKYLRWELEQHPLPGQDWSAERLLRLLDAVAAGDLAAQRLLFVSLETLARERGHGEVVDAWGDDVVWLRDG